MCPFHILYISKHIFWVQINFKIKMFSLGKSDNFLIFLIKSRLSKNIRTQHSTHMQLLYMSYILGPLKPKLPIPLRDSYSITYLWVLTMLIPFGTYCYGMPRVCVYFDPRSAITKHSSQHTTFKWNYLKTEYDFEKNQNEVTFSVLVETAGEKKCRKILFLPQKWWAISCF